MFSRGRKSSIQQEATALPLTAHVEAYTKGPYGLEICHDDEQAIADIVFVHGLTGNRDSTWTSPNEVFWPKALLPGDLPNTRIMTYGYDADIAHFWAMASQNRIGEHAGNLVNAVTQIRERTDTEKRPIIFVTHSLGGLVTEDALLYSKNSAEPHLQALLHCVVGICFLGTPHCGSDLARWGSILGSLANVVKTANVDIVNVLKTDSEVLARVQREFHTMLRAPASSGRPAFSITCFFEEFPVRGVGEIVPKHSAILPSYNAIGIRANHMDMTKFGSRGDPGYLSVCGELRRWVKAIRARQSEQLHPEVSSTRYDDLGRGFAPFEDAARRYAPCGGTERARSPYGEYAQPIQRYGEDGQHFENPYLSEHNSHSQSPWDQSQTSSPPPASNREPYQGYAPSQGMLRYQLYRSGGGYVRPPPPPEPRYVDDPPSMASPPPSLPMPQYQAQEQPPWGRSPEYGQQTSGFFQGANVIASHNQQTYDGGKTVQGNNLNVSGNVSF